MGLEKYFYNEERYKTIIDEEKTSALVIIRENLTENLLNLILTQKDPNMIFNNLRVSYEGIGPVLRQQLYLQFHQMKVENYKTVI